jgi:GntR family transcriptional repressor for pyruvate dehydrogenase complex
VWLANVFWAPMRELHERLAGAIGHIPSDYQARMERLCDLIAARDEVDAEAHVIAWFDGVDAQLVGDLEKLLSVPIEGKAVTK